MWLYIPRFYNFPSTFSFDPCNKPLRQAVQKSLTFNWWRNWGSGRLFFPQVHVPYLLSWISSPEKHVKTSQCLSGSKHSTYQLFRIFTTSLPLFPFKKEDLKVKWHPILISPNCLAFWGQIGNGNLFSYLWEHKWSNMV